MRTLLYRVFSALAEDKVRRLEADSKAPREAQLNKLLQVLNANAESRFGREHNFASIRTWDDFDRAMPIRDYEGFRPYVDALANGESKVLTVEPVTMFATTSGTTDKPKFIPITPGYIKEFRAASIVSGYFLLKNFPGLAHGNVLPMTSPAEDGRTPCGIPYGSISGSLFKNEPFLIKKFISPIPYEVFLIKDYESKYYALLRAALALPVSLIYTLNPSTIQLLCRRLSTHAESLIKDVRDGTITPPTELPRSCIDALKPLTKANPVRAQQLDALFKSGQFTADKIWPTLQVVSCWTKAAASFYLSDFPQYFGDTPVCDITYGASEGRGTVFLSPHEQMLSLQSHFFEFVPEEEMNSDKPTILLADELEQGRNYFILFTTSGGLYRYNINDVVKVTGFHNRTPLLEFQYKGGNISSFTGEKITELQVTESMRTALATTGNRARFFTVIPQFRPEPHYELLLEFDECSIHGDRDLLVKEFEAALRLMNIEYDTKRNSGRLAPVTCRTMGGGTYERLRKHLTAAGTPDAQIKISHLNPKKEITEALLTV